jgi:hypothetical protein
MLFMIAYAQMKLKAVVIEPNRKPIGYDTRYQRSPIDPCSSPVCLTKNSVSKTAVKQYSKQSARFNYGESQKLLRSINTTNTSAAISATTTTAAAIAGATATCGTVRTTGEYSSDSAAATSGAVHTNKHSGDSDSDTESCPEDDLPGGIWDKVYTIY